MGSQKPALNPKDKILVTQLEAAALLSTSEPTIRRLVKSNILKCLELQGGRKFRVETLNKFGEEMEGKKIDLSRPFEEIIKRLA